MPRWRAAAPKTHTSHQKVLAMRRLLALSLLTLALLALTACSDDGGDEAGGSAEDASTDDSTADSSTDDSTPGAGSGSSSEFCEQVDDQVALFEGTGDVPTAEELAGFDDLVAAAPPVIQPDLETVQQTLTAISELGEDPESFTEAFDLLFDPEFIGAIEQVGLFVEAECGLDLETPSEAGVDSPGGDEGDEPAGAGVDSDALRAYVTAEDAAVEERIQSVVTVAGSEIGVGVRNLDDPAEAVTICEILSGYAYDQVGDPDLTINVNNTSGATLASRDGEAGTCEAAA